MNKPPRLTYFSYAPSYDVSIGGVIFQHQLVHTLNTLGETAYLWPMAPINPQRRLRRLYNQLFPSRYQCDPALNTPVAGPSDLDETAVMIYPEIVRGNPVGVKNVVRWLLYKPGVRHPYEFTEGDLFMRAFEKADLPDVTGGAHDLHLWRINPVYKNENRSDRKGVCYAVRKGRKKSRIPETETSDAILIDERSPEEINDIFNRCETFISYDEATMYSQYAALCGCLSVVVPGDYASRAEMVAEHDLYRYGVAYGLDDIAHALATRDRVADMLRQKEASGIESVKTFITLAQQTFMDAE